MAKSATPSGAAVYARTERVLAIVKSRLTRRPLTRGSYVARYLRAHWAALALCCLTPRAHASGALPAGSSVEYSAPEGCPGRAEFIASILASVPQAVISASAGASIHFRVELSGGAGTLWIELENGSSRRDIREASCQDALASMALIAAMVIEAEPAQRLSVADVRGAPMKKSAPAVQPSSNAEVVPTVATAPAEAAAALPPSRATGTGHVPPGVSVALGFMAESAVRTMSPPGIAAGAELSRKSASGWGAVGRAELLATLAATEHRQDGNVKLRLLAGRLSACALRQLSLAWYLLPCFTFDVGKLYAAGADVLDAEQTTMPWLAFGLLLGARFDVQTSWGVEGTLGAKLLARHDRFYFRPDSTVYDVPRLSVGATAGIRFRVF
jgi:hypothetical protein